MYEEPGELDKGRTLVKEDFEALRKLFSSAGVSYPLG
jgi:hypothetical protein